MIDGSSLSPGFAVFDGVAGNAPRYLVVELYQDNGWYLRLVGDHGGDYYYDPYTDTIAQTSHSSGLVAMVVKAAGLQNIVGAGMRKNITGLKKSNIFYRLIPTET